MGEMNVNQEIIYCVTGGAWGCKTKVFSKYFLVSFAGVLGVEISGKPSKFPQSQIKSNFIMFQSHRLYCVQVLVARMTGPLILRVQ